MSDDIIQLEDINLTGRQPDDDAKLYGPPGTGKTTEITGQIGLLLRDYEYRVEDILAVTYRRSLAEETLKRLYEWDLIGIDEYENPNQNRTKFIGTIHAVCMRLLGGMKGNPASQVDYAEFFEQEFNVRYDSNESRPWTKGRGKLAMQTINWLKSNQMPVRQYERAPPYQDLWQEWPEHPPLSEVERRWEAYKNENNLWEYHELLEEVLEQQLTPDTPVVVVDEYQDAYPLLHEVSQMWLDDAEVSVAAGDPKQVVNSHEGSSPRYFEELDLPEVHLDYSYRVPSSHWNLATSVLDKVETPPTVETSGDGEIYELEVPHMSFSSYKWKTPTQKRGTPDWFVEKFASPDEPIMFLTRTRMQAKGVAESLKEAGIPFEGQSFTGGWNNAPRRRNLYNALQKLDGLSVTRIEWGNWSADDNVKLSSEEAADLLRHARVEDLSINKEEAWNRANNLEDWGQPVGVEEFAQRYTKESFWDSYTRSHRSVEFLTDGLNDDDKDILRTALLRNSALIYGSIPIRVLTIHASKGAEAHTAVVYDGITKRVQQSMDNNPRIRHNEYRTWYVALSRAKQNLVVARDAFDFTEQFIPRLATAEAKNASSRAVTADD